MRRRIPLSCVTVLAALCSSASAQELHIYTTTHDVNSPTAPPLARSVTLFHAGKVYDLVPESNEVTIYEPVSRRFTLLQINSGTASEVSQDQVRRYLAVAEEKLADQVEDLARQPGKTPPGALQLLEFQLHPKFEKKLDPSGAQLTLSSPRCRYEVEAVKPPEAAIATAYLKYADALAELNAVLNPHAMLPAPRLQVNNELRERGLLPVTVRRRIETDRTVDLRVKHEWKYRLEEHDRQLITFWESCLGRNDLRRVPFEQLQREILTGKLTQR